MLQDLCLCTVRFTFARRKRRRKKHTKWLHPKSGIAEIRPRSTASRFREITKTILRRTRWHNRLLILLLYKFCCKLCVWYAPIDRMRGKFDYEFHLTKKIGFRARAFSIFFSFLSLFFVLVAASHIKFSAYTHTQDKYDQFGLFHPRVAGVFLHIQLWISLAINRFRFHFATQKKCNIQHISG